jgi:hypothetical protein
MPKDLNEKLFMALSGEDGSMDSLKVAIERRKSKKAEEKTLGQKGPEKDTIGEEKIDNVQDKKLEGEDKDLYEKVREYILDTKKTSLVEIAKKFKISQKKANVFFSILEKEEIIGPSKNGVEPREFFGKKNDEEPATNTKPENPEVGETSENKNDNKSAENNPELTPKMDEASEETEPAIVPVSEKVLEEIAKKIKEAKERLTDDEQAIYNDYSAEIFDIIEKLKGEEMLLPEEIEFEKVMLADLEKNATAAIEKNRGFFIKAIDKSLEYTDSSYGENEEGWEGFRKKMTKTAINATLIGLITVAMKQFILSNVFSNAITQTATNMATKYGTGLLTRVAMATAMGAFSEGGVATSKGIVGFQGKELSEEKLKKIKKWMPIAIGGMAVIGSALIAGSAGAALLGGGSLYLGYKLSEKLRTDKLGIGKGNEDKKIEAKKKLLDKYHIPEGATEINLSKDDMGKFEKDFETYIQFCSKMDRTNRIKERTVKLGAAALTGTIIAGASMGVSMAVGEVSNAIHAGHDNTTPEAKVTEDTPKNDLVHPNQSNTENHSMRDMYNKPMNVINKIFGHDTNSEKTNVAGGEHKPDVNNEVTKPDANQRQEYVTPNKVEDTGKEFMGDHKGFPGTMGEAWDGIKGEEHNAGDQRNEYVTPDGKTNVQHQPDADHGNNQPNQPEVKLTPEQMKDIVVHKGEGIESTFIRQIEHNPELAKELGYNGDPSDTKALHAFAGREAHILAIKEGYVDKDGHEVRIAEADKIGYGIKMENGHATINEISADGKVLEIHHEGDKFGNNHSKYEYFKDTDIQEDHLINPKDIPITNQYNADDYIKSEVIDLNNFGTDIKPEVTDLNVKPEIDNFNKIPGVQYGTKFEYADKPEYQADTKHIDTGNPHPSTHHYMTPREAFYFTQENLNKMVDNIFHSDKLMSEWNDHIKNNMTANDLLKMHHDKSYPDDLHSHELKQLAIRMEKIQEITGTKPETHMFGDKSFDESVDQYLRREILEIEKMGMLDKIKRWL